MRRNPLHDFADPAFERMRIAVTTPTHSELPWEERLLAGCAEVDITPPPGMPKAGHSKNAHDGTGFRTRLRARVLHLRAGHSSLTLIACDLLSGSAIVHRLLADQLADDTDVRLPGLFLGATHTHAGPGQFSGSEFYNRWSSNRPGFDPAYTGFLVDRLAAAVRTAVAGRRPARLAFGSTEVWGYTRNRSLPAHVRNATETDKRTEPQRKYTAVNPWLHLLRVDTDGTGQAEGSVPMAAFAWFSIHGTGISHHDRSYNADVWAYLTGELAQRVHDRTGTRPVVGAVEGTHGDMTPAVRPGMLVFPEAERVGRGIGAAAAELHARLGESLHSRVDLAAGLREVDMSAHPEVAGIRLPEPRIGVAKLAGAQENTTPLLDRIPPFRPGCPRRPHGMQAEKRVVAGEPAHRVVNPTASFPQFMPVQLLRIDDVAILGLPFEVTVAAGRRIADAVRARSDAETVVVSSLANDHCDYLTTAEEYAAQYYEGASTLYGPRQQEFVAACAADLAEDLAEGGVVADVPGHRVFDFTVRHYRARPDGVPAPRRAERARFVDATAVEDAHWRMEWSDVGPGDLHWHAPLVRVQTELEDGSWAPAAQDGLPVDDQGWRVGVEYLGGSGGRHRYVTRWFAPPLGRPGRHRFVLCANAGQPEIAGQPFD
ncbi:neutral/alkaline non-lysosomal ceramidase N-terminal domain-containing protein [Speluncibacter jeojiensis]|uniref:Neutral ceramidase n=1 Tax=Speluncibacter jeojiensis TaxID=2710754 RepID=A0A9X4M3I2_9ACTN|nr:neutral/alkaline non-lysosomal ceramidase N-terminal domain-containing protein [Corynebacteriales bacterium D3-21]